MKYLVRAIKYFIYLMIILTIIIVALILTKMVDSDISKIFVNGYDSLWQIALMMAVFALIYPRMGFCSRLAHFYGSTEELKPEIMRVMTILSYKIEKEEQGRISFIKDSAFSRLIKMYEDRITISSSAAGLEVEGLTKDVVRIISALESAREDE